MNATTNHGTAELKEYEVCFNLLVRATRGATLPAFPVGTVLHLTERFVNCGRAVRFFEGLLAGQYDCTSDVVTRAEVRAMHTNRSPSWVRRPVAR